MNRLIQIVEGLISQLNEKKRLCQELEDDRNRWYLRAVRMATADDLRQWAREGDRPGDMIFLSGEEVISL